MMMINNVRNSAQRVGFFNTGSGISRYLFYSRVFPGMLGIFGYFWVYPYILRFLSIEHILRAEKITTKPNWLR